MAGNRVHDSSLSNSLGSEGETCSQEPEPPPRGRSSFGDAPEDPMPSWEIDPATITCAGDCMFPHVALLLASAAQAPCRSFLRPKREYSNLHITHT